METLKKYNQILVSVIGTGVVIFFLVLLIIEFQPRSYQDNTLITGPEMDSLNKNNLRKQVVSLNHPQIIDSAENLYLIPVTHETLEKAEDKAIFDFIGSSNEARLMVSSWQYNNFLAYNFNTGSSVILLEDRMNINRYELLKTNFGNFLIYWGWDADTNEDGKFDNMDVESYFICDLSTYRSNRIEHAGFTIDNYQFDYKMHRLIFDAFDSSKERELGLEPTYLFNYNFQEGTLTPLVDSETLNQLQRIIDGE